MERSCDCHVTLVEIRLNVKEDSILDVETYCWAQLWSMLLLERMERSCDCHVTLRKSHMMPSDRSEAPMSNCTHKV